MFRMKKIISLFSVALILISCSGATDGDANTDTTTLTIDTGGLNAPNDTANHVNTNTGEYPKDSTTGVGKTDIRSSSPTDPKSRSTTPGSDTSRKQ
jgi:hypothetical protein